MVPTDRQIEQSAFHFVTVAEVGDISVAIARDPERSAWVAFRAQGPFCFVGCGFK